MTIEAAIQNVGFIPAVQTSSREPKLYDREVSTEDYVGKITAIFSPYISPKSISETKFVRLQENLKRIVVEIKGKETKN